MKQKSSKSTLLADNTRGLITTKQKKAQASRFCSTTFHIPKSRVRTNITVGVGGGTRKRPVKYRLFSRIYRENLSSFFNRSETLTIKLTHHKYLFVLELEPPYTKKTEFLYKSSINIDVLPVFFGPLGSIQTLPHPRTAAMTIQVCSTSEKVAIRCYKVRGQDITSSIIPTIYYYI